MVNWIFNVKTVPTILVMSGSYKTRNDHTMPYRNAIMKARYKSSIHKAGRLLVTKKNANEFSSQNGEHKSIEKYKLDCRKL